MVTFAVNDVTPAAQPPTTVSAGVHAAKLAQVLDESAQQIDSTTPARDKARLIDAAALSKHPHGLIKAETWPVSCEDEARIPMMHGFIFAVYKAFAEHHPLALRPEHLWTLVLQGVAQGVLEHAEALRSHFVAHEGKMQLLVRDDKLVLGSADNNWASTIQAFGEQLAQHTRQDVADLMACDFSSTTADERACGQVVIMHALQQYFSYDLVTLCGFPSISLEGTLDDWRALRAKAEALVRAKCTSELACRWLPALLPVLDRLVAQFADPSTVDVAFWQSMCKRGGTTGSGAQTWLSGWFNVLLPYVDNGQGGIKPNTFCVPYRSDAGYVAEGRVNDVLYEDSNDAPSGVDGTPIELLPTGIVTAPVQWSYLSHTYDLAYHAGFVGAEVRPDGVVAPVLGWLISGKMGSTARAHATDGEAEASEEVACKRAKHA